MEHGNLIAGLIRKKAEITAQVEALQMQLRSRKDTMESVYYLGFPSLFG